MIFYSNPCSAQYAYFDPFINFNRNLMISIIFIEILIIFLLRFLSSLKNYDLNLIRKQIQAQKSTKKSNFKIEDIQNLQKLENHNKIITNKLQNKEKKTDFINFLMKKYKNNKSQQKSQSNESSSQENSQQSQIYKDSQQQNQQFQQEKWFINLGKLKLTYNKFIQSFYLFIGHSMIAIACVSVHFPYFYASILVLVHFFIFLFLIFFNICKKDKEKYNDNNSVEYSLNSSQSKTKQIQSTHNLLINFTAENNQQHQNQSKSQQKNQTKFKCAIFSVNNLLFGLIFVMNISLLFMCVMGIKMSYFDPFKNQCININYK